MWIYKNRLHCGGGNTIAFAEFCINKRCLKCSFNYLNNGEFIDCSGFEHRNGEYLILREEVEI